MEAIGTVEGNQLKLMLRVLILEMLVLMLTKAELRS